MATASFYGEKKVNGDVYGVKLVCSSVPNAANNSSEVTVKIYLVHGVISIGERKYPTHDCTYGINGVTYTYSTPEIKKASTDTPIVTKTVTIQHDSDGSKTIDVYANFPYNLKRSSDGVRINTVTASGKFVLDIIGRSSAIIDQTFEVEADDESQWFLKVARSANSFWHKATLTIGSLEETTDAFETEIRGTAQKKWLEQMTDSKTGTMNVSVQTYADAGCTEAIGDPVRTTFTVKAPQSAAPTVASGGFQFQKITSNNVNAFIQHHTGIKAVFNAKKVTTVRGAKIASWWVELEGKKYSAPAEYIDDVLQDANISTKTITGTGDITFRLGLTDSRGLEAFGDVTRSVYPYAKPTLKNISVYRCDEAGKADDEGTYIYIRAEAVFSDCDGNNPATLSASVGQIGSTNVDNHELVSGDGMVVGGDIGTKKSYQVSIFVVDKVGSSASYNTTVGTSEVSFHIRNGGKGAAFGKYAESTYDGYVDFAWNIKMQQNKCIYDKNGNEVTGIASGDYITKKIIPSELVTASGQTHDICTITEPGIYLMLVSVSWYPAQNTGQLTAAIRKNGSTSDLVVERSAAYSGLQTSDVMTIEQLDKGDVLQLFIAQTSVNSGLQVGDARFKALRLGAVPKTT